MTQTPPIRIGISGSYGGLNLGDEAILQGILEALRDMFDAEVTVFSRDAADTLARHNVARAVPVREMSKDEIRPEIERLDLLILGGGGLLYDASVMKYLREVTIAHELGVRVFLWAVGVGPLHNESARQAVREALQRFDVITVRDRRSQRLLDEIAWGHEVQVTADPALLLEPAPPSAALLRREGLNRGPRLIGLSVREPGEAAPDLNIEHYHALLANAADFMIDRYDARLVFVPLEPRMLDLQHAHAVMARMAFPQRASILKGQYSVQELISLVGHFEFALGMRLHFLIFAALQRVPFLALPYGSKVQGFIEEFNMSLPRMEHINNGQLISYVDRAWDQRHKLREQIDAVLPGLRERARHSARLAAGLLARRAGAAAPD